MYSNCTYCTNNGNSCILAVITCIVANKPLNIACDYDAIPKLHITMMPDSRSFWCGHNDAICAPGRENAAPGNGTPGAKKKKKKLCPRLPPLLPQ